MKRSRMREVSIEVTVGAVMFMILLVLGVFTIILSRENIFKKNYEVETFFQNVMGLNEGDNVLFHGVKIGMVKELVIEPSGVTVKANVDRVIEFHDDYSVEILSSSVLGGHYLSLNEGTHSHPVLAQGTVLRGKPPVDIIADAADTIAMIRNSLGRGKILDNLQVTMEQLKDISSRINAGEGTLGKIINDDTIYDDFQVIVADMKEVSGRLARGEGTLGKLLTNDELYNEIQKIAADVRVVSDEVAAGRGTIGKLLTSDSLYYNVDAVASNLAVVSSRLVEGKGTLGKLSRDSDLYDQIEDTLNETRAMLDDIRTTSPIVAFSSVFFGAF